MSGGDSVTPLAVLRDALLKARLNYIGLCEVLKNAG